jgi:hypothetical protein
MRIITWKQAIAAAGKSQQWFQSVRRRKQIALAWGLSEDMPRGVYCDVDAAALRLTDDLAVGVGPTQAARIMRGHAHAWMQAVALADSETSPVFLLYIEYDWGRQYNLTATTLDRIDDIAKSRDKRFIPTRMVWLNVTATLQNIRINAALIGLDLSDRFLPPLDDVLYDELVRKKSVARERALALVREHHLAGSKRRLSG